MSRLSIDAAAPKVLRTDRDLASWLAGATLAAAAVELVLLRLVSRTAIHIPGIQEVAGPYRLVAATGRYAYYSAAVLVTTTLALLAHRQATQGRTGHATAVGAVILTTLATRLGWLDATTLAVVVVVSALMLSVGIIRAHPRLGTSVGLFAAAFLAAAVHATVQDLSGAGDLRPASTIGLLLAAEVMLFLAVLALPRATPAIRSTDVIVGGALALVVLGALSASPATIKVLMLWTIGLPGYFPPAVYALTAAVLATTLLATLRADRELAVGLGLLVAGGIGLHNSYQTALVVCGLALLADRAGDSRSDAHGDPHLGAKSREHH